MSETEYIDRKEELMEKIDRTSIWENDRLSRLFHFTSAGLFHLLPDVGQGSHERIFRQILLTQQLSYLESRLNELPARLQIENLDMETDSLLKTRPVVICTYHTGSYQLVNLLLALKGVHFSLVVRRKTFREFGKEYQELYKQNNRDANGLGLIDAESGHCALQMLRALKSGRSLVIYIDGNMGAGNPGAPNTNGCEINFLNRQLIARKGLAYIAHTANVPILGAISYRPDWNSLAIRFGDVICPSAHPDRELFSMLNTQKLYGILEEVVREYPGQWEGWLYLNNIMGKLNDVPNVPAQRIAVAQETDLDNLRYNSGGFGVFKAGTGTYILDKKRFETFFIAPVIHDILKNAQASGRVSTTSLQPDTVRQLIGRGVLLSL